MGEPALHVCMGIASCHMQISHGVVRHALWLVLYGCCWSRQSDSVNKVSRQRSGASYEPAYAACRSLLPRKSWTCCLGPGSETTSTESYSGGSGSRTRRRSSSSTMQAPTSSWVLTYLADVSLLGTCLRLACWHHTLQLPAPALHLLVTAGDIPCSMCLAMPGACALIICSSKWHMGWLTLLQGVITRQHGSSRFQAT